MNPNDVSRRHVWRPAKDVANSRTLLLLHGTGADENDLIGLGRSLDRDANLLSPRGLVMHQGMSRFFLRHDDGSFDEAGIIKNAHELANFLADAAETYGFDASTVWAVGFSNGANAAGSLLILHPESLAGIIAFGTTRSFQKVAKVPDLRGKRVFIANGEIDGYSPHDATAKMVKEFRGWGASVQLLMHPGGHTIALEHVRKIGETLG